MGMKLRRCAFLYIEAYEEPSLDIARLAFGGDGLVVRQVWRAFAPHLDGPVELAGGEHALLGQLETTRWTPSDSIDPGLHPVVERLLRVGLLIGDQPEHASMRERDESVRNGHWWGTAALMHRLGRWQGLDCVEAMRADGTDTTAGLIAKRGLPPPAVISRNPAQALPRVQQSDLDHLLARRATCRNFDRGQPLSLEQLAGILQRVFSAQGQVTVDSGAVFLKKNAPSAGGLHCVEAYLLIRRVDGVASGLYHYHPVDHALELIAARDEHELDALAVTMVAGQHWFADAPVLVVMAPRYERLFWKYRNHAKAYRAMILDAGHLSQLLFLCATEMGLGAFVTAAVNEVDIEQAFGMDALSEGPLTVSGFGWRAERMTTSEFDPGEHVWYEAANEAR